MIPAIIIALFSAVFLADYLPLLKQPGEKGKVVYGVLLAVSLCVLLLYSFDIPVPSPTEPIRKAIDALFPMQNQ